MIYTLFFAIVQLLVEALPVSSSGHIRLITLWLHYNGFKQIEGLPCWLEEVLYGLTLCMITFYFRGVWVPLIKRVFFVVRQWRAHGYAYSALQCTHKRFALIILNIFGMVMLIDSITAGFYVLIKIVLKHNYFLQHTSMLLVGFFITALALFLSNYCTKSYLIKRSPLSCVVLLGCLQGIALLPGISRFGITMVGGLLCGLSPQRALQMSWLIFLPLMSAAFFLQGLPELCAHCNYEILKPSWLILLSVAAIASYGLLYSVEYALVRKKLWLYGLYMLVPIGFLLSLLIVAQ